MQHIGRRVINESQGGESHGGKEKLLGPESSARARPPFPRLLLACCWLQQCPEPCHGLASLSTLTQSCQVLLGTSRSVLLTPSGRTCSRPLPQLVVISFAPTLLLGSASKRGTFLLLLPSPCGCYRDTVPGRGPRLVTPTAGTSSPSLQPCFICCHLPATTWHRLWTVSLPSWTISSYLLSVPCTHSRLCLTSLKTLSFDFSFSLELELFRV